MPTSILIGPTPRFAPAPTAFRWEWRSFGRTFGGAEQRLPHLMPSAAQESDEIYLLSASGDNVKVRDGLMDVKVLRGTNGDGLEQWAPTLKAPFPLSPAEVERVLDALGCPLRVVAKDCETLDSFVATFAGPECGIRVVHVHKRRQRYTFEGCMAELSEVRADGRQTRTLAVEGPDPAAVIHAVEALGLADYVNMSYPRGLDLLLRNSAERFAVIDVGTNSVKFHIGERDLDGNWTKVTDRASVTRLGEGLSQNGMIGDAAVERTVAAIFRMAGEAQRAGVRATAAVGTAGLRMARNRDQVIAAIKQRTGLVVQIISGEEEARLAYLATIASLGHAHGTVAVFDTGGGSSQFTFGHGSAVDERFSVNAGAARYTDIFGLAGPVLKDGLDRAKQAIAEDLSRLDDEMHPDSLIGMGGAVTNLAAVKHGLSDYDPDVVHGSVLDAEEIDRQIELYRSRGTAARRLIPGLQPDRAETILAGACIVRTILEKLGKTNFTVSDRGLRHGVLVERFGF